MALWKCLSNWYKLQAVQNVKKLLADLSAEELLLRPIVHELSAAHPGQPSGTYIELPLSGLGSGSAGAIIPGGNNCMYGENLVAETVAWRPASRQSRPLCAILKQAITEEEPL